ncbi:unnamed protein product, partial [Polarella glacialis]
ALLDQALAKIARGHEEELRRVTEALCTENASLTRQLARMQMLLSSASQLPSADAPPTPAPLEIPIPEPQGPQFGVAENRSPGSSAACDQRNAGDQILGGELQGTPSNQGMSALVKPDGNQALDLPGAVDQGDRSALSAVPNSEIERNRPATASTAPVVLQSSSVQLLQEPDEGTRLAEEKFAWIRFGKDKVCDYGYSSCSREDRKEVMNLGSNKRVAFEVVGLLLILYDLVWWPAQVFGFASNPFTRAILWLSSAFWACDLIVSFFVGVTIIDQGLIEMRVSKIARHYARTWLPVDLSLVLLDWTLNALVLLSHQEVADFGGGTFLEKAQLLRLLRLLRLFKASGFISALSDRIQSEATRILVRVLKLLIFIMLINHLIACSWYEIGINDIEREDTWVKAYDLKEKEAVYAYTRMSAEARYVNEAQWKGQRSKPAQAVRAWMRKFVPEEVSKRVHDLWGYKEEKGVDGGHAIVTGLLRVESTQVKALIRHSGQGGWYVEPLRWADPAPEPCNVDWVKRVEDESGPEYAARVQAIAGDLGIARGERSLGVRKTRGEESQSRSRAWRICGAPKAWNEIPIIEALTAAGLQDVRKISRRNLGKSTEWWMQATGAHDVDFLEIEKDAATIVAAAAGIRRRPRVNQRRLPSEGRVVYRAASPDGKDDVTMSDDKDDKDGKDGKDGNDGKDVKDGNDGNDGKDGKDDAKRPARSGHSPPPKRRAVGEEGLGDPDKPKSHRSVRAALVAHLRRHEQNYKDWWDGKAPASGDVKCKSWEVYLEELAKDGAWGGALEVAAAAVHYDRPVVVFQPQGQPEIYNSKGKGNAMALWLQSQHWEPLHGRVYKEDLAKATKGQMQGRRGGGGGGGGSVRSGRSGATAASALASFGGSNLRRKADSCDDEASEIISVAQTASRGRSRSSKALSASSFNSAGTGRTRHSALPASSVSKRGVAKQHAAPAVRGARATSAGRSTGIVASSPSSTRTGRARLSVCPASPGSMTAAKQHTVTERPDKRAAASSPSSARTGRTRLSAFPASPGARTAAKQHTVTERPGKRAAASSPSSARTGRTTLSAFPASPGARTAAKQRTVTERPGKPAAASSPSSARAGRTRLSAVPASPGSRRTTAKQRAATERPDSRNVKAPSRRNRAGSPKTSPRTAPASPGSRRTTAKQRPVTVGPGARNVSAGRTPKREATESARGYADSVATIEAFDLDEPEDEVPVLAQEAGPKPLGRQQARRRPAKRRTKTKWWIQEKQRHVSAWHPAEAASLDIDRKQLCVVRELAEGEEVAWKCPLCTQGLPSGTLASTTAGAYGRRVRRLLKHPEADAKLFNLKGTARQQAGVTRCNTAWLNAIAARRLASLVRGDGLEHEVSMFRWPAGCRKGRSDIICNKCKHVRRSVKQLAKLPCELINVGHKGCPRAALLQRLQLQADSAEAQAAAPNRYGMRIAAMNVQTLVAKLALVIAIAEEYSIDILFLQETRLGPDTELAAMLAAKKAGWQLCVGPRSVDAAGSPTAGVAVLSRWPVERMGPPPGVACGGRAMRVRVRRPHKRHLEACNLYLRASDPAAAVDLGEALLKAGAEGGEDRIFIGDWNSIMEGASIMPLSPSMWWSSPGSNTGLADHDLVVYELESDALELPSRRRAPARLQTKSKVETEDWEELWQRHDGNYRQALREGNAQRAWTILSDVAEQLLLQGDAAPRKRSAVPRPTQAAVAHSRPEVLQGVRERRLRRLARRVKEFQRDTAQPRLRRKVNEAGAELAKRHPELAGREWMVSADHDLLCQLADEQAARDGRERIQRWCAKMEEDEIALMRWIKAARTGGTQETDTSTPTHPQLKAEFKAEEWKKVWNPPTLPTDSAVDPFMSWVPEGGFHCPVIRLTSSHLKHVARKAVGKSAGPDEWTADAWMCLLDEFFERLAEVWNLVLDGAELPEPWLEVRCVLIPKAEGGVRPISVAALAWRIGMASVLRMVQPWVEQWAPEELVGGLSKRSADELHERLQSAIADALARRATLAGAKLDVKKCFDSVKPDQACYIWRRLGAPEQLVSVISRFYSGHRRWMEWQGACARAPVSCTRGLLQGCPASGLLLAAMMAVWTEHLRQECPDVEVGVFVDDRTLWVESNAPDVELETALDKAAQVDAAMGLELRPDKGELFATANKGRKNLHELSRRVGPVREHFKLLGLRYNTTNGKRTPVEARAVAIVAARLRRIPKAVKSRWKRIKMVRALVLPMVTFTGAWTRPTKDQIAKWRSAVETAVLGRIMPGRSRFLVWAALLGPQVDPDFMIHMAALRHEQWRARRRAANHQLQQDAATACGRMREVAAKWGWTHLLPGQFDTKTGILELGWDGEATIKSAAARGWEAMLWKQEPRARDDSTTALHSVGHPGLGARKAWLNGDGGVFGPRVEAALGTGRDGRYHSKILGEECFCSCGEVNPGRRHLTWHCGGRTAGMLRMPSNGGEEGLLVVTAPNPGRARARHGAREHSVGLAQALGQESLRLHGAAVLVAADGGSQGKVADERVAAWGVALAGHSEGGSVPGMDQTSAAAELWALIELLRAAAAALAPLIVIIDNKGVANRAAALARGLTRVSRAAPQAWAEVRELLALISGTSVHWVPSHGKHPEWSPPGGHLDRIWRELNDRADGEASRLAERRWAERVSEREAVAGAKDWSRRALCTQLAALAAFGRLVNPEVVPVNELERSFTIVVLMSAMVIFSSFISTITYAMNQLKNLNSERNAELVKLRRFFSENRVSASLVSRISSCIHQSTKLTSSRVHGEDISILELLPASLKCDLAEEVYAPTLCVHPLLLTWAEYYPRESKRLFVAARSFSLGTKHELFHAGQVAENLYFLSSGQMVFVRDDRELQHEPPAFVSPGQWLAEPAMWIKWKHVGQSSSAENCELVLLPCDAAARILSRSNASSYAGARRYAQTFAAYFAKQPDRLSD